MKTARIFSKPYGAKLFSTLDVQSGYYNITVDEHSRKSTAFTTEYRKYEFLHIPFGIHVVPNYFAMMINETLKGLDFCFAYLDSIINYSKIAKEHLDHMRQIFDSINEANIKLKLTKYDFFKSQHFLGHLLSEEGISPLSEKLGAIKPMPPHRNIKELRQF